MEKETDKKYEVMKTVMDALDDILCSYPGRGHQTVYIDLDSLALLASLIVYGQIKAEKHQYEYNVDVDKDEEAVRIYRELAPQTRWRMGCHTQIEPIRINALKQLAAMGTPVYNGHVYYAETGSVLECGEILPFEIFQLFYDMPELKKLYVFPYPFRNEKEQPVYFSFEPTEAARKEMRKYVEKKFEEAHQIAEKTSSNVIPDVKEIGF